MPRAAKSRRSRRDLKEIAAYLAERADLRTANRFLEAAERLITRLAEMPQMGALWEGSDPDLGELRFMRIRRFPNHIVFYRPSRGGIEVVRVLYGGMDIDEALKEN